MNQLTTPVPDVRDRQRQLRIRDRLRQAVQERTSAPRCPVELRVRWY